MNIIGLVFEIIIFDELVHSVLERALVDVLPQGPLAEAKLELQYDWQRSQSAFKNLHHHDEVRPWNHHKLILSVLGGESTDLFDVLVNCLRDFINQKTSPCVKSSDAGISLLHILGCLRMLFPVDLVEAADVGSSGHDVKDFYLCEGLIDL